MKFTQIVLSLSLSTAALVVAPASSWACGGDKKTVVEVSVQDGAKLSKAGEALFVDANGTETRSKMGVIPGAILLSHYENYDASRELATAKKEQRLVFYCANEMCGASKVAAERAMAQGWHNVSVLPVGIKGWKAAGMPTAQVAPAPTKSGQG